MKAETFQQKERRIQDGNAKNAGRIWGKKGRTEAGRRRETVKCGPIGGKRIEFSNCRHMPSFQELIIKRGQASGRIENIAVGLAAETSRWPRTAGGNPMLRITGEITKSNQDRWRQTANALQSADETRTSRQATQSWRLGVARHERSGEEAVPQESTESAQRRSDPNESERKLAAGREIDGERTWRWGGSWMRS